MAALAETASKITEFAGDYKMAVVEVNPAAASGSVTVDEMSVVVGVVVSFKEAPTADQGWIYAAVDGTTTNQINVAMLESDYSASTQNYKDFYLIAIGY